MEPRSRIEAGPATGTAKRKKARKRDRERDGRAAFLTPVPSVEIFVADIRWRRLVPRVERLARLAAIAGGGAGTVVLDRDLRVRRLNGRHRGRNKPTNVLTFEMPPGIPGGDIVLGLETVRREALAAGRWPRHHLVHLVVHGALHLRGHDHHGAGQARRMEMREARILHRLGVPNPWKPRPLPGATR